MAQVTVDTVPHLEDFGLERLDRAIVCFAQKAEAGLVRWLDFVKGALLFLTQKRLPKPKVSLQTTDCGGDIP